jgi:hypothetical protein
MLVRLQEESFAEKQEFDNSVNELVAETKAGNLMCYGTRVYRNTPQLI